MVCKVNRMISSESQDRNPSAELPVAGNKVAAAFCPGGTPQLSPCFRHTPSSYSLEKKQRQCATCLSSLFKISPKAITNELCTLPLSCVYAHWLAGWMLAIYYSWALSLQPCPAAPLLSTVDYCHLLEKRDRLPDNLTPIPENGVKPHKLLTAGTGRYQHSCEM